MRKLESNEKLRQTLESLQMPTVEYKEINTEDYSRCRGETFVIFAFVRHASTRARLRSSLVSADPQTRRLHGDVPLSSAAARVRRKAARRTDADRRRRNSQRLIVPVRSDGTPGGQAVTERFRADWATALASSFGAVVARCDGRGGGFRGTNLLHRIQKRLGVFEEQDQKDALRCVPKCGKGQTYAASVPPAEPPTRLLQFPAERALRRQEQSRRVREGKSGRERRRKR